MKKRKSFEWKKERKGDKSIKEQKENVWVKIKEGNRMNNKRKMFDEKKKKWKEKGKKYKTYEEKERKVIEWKELEYTKCW